MLEIRAAICFTFIYLSIAMIQLDKRVKKLEKVVKHHKEGEQKMEKSNFKPCSHNKTCKECLIEEYKDIYPNIDQIVVEGVNIMLSTDILGMDKRKATIKIINDAVIIDDGVNEDYLCNCITDDGAVSAYTCLECVEEWLEESGQVETDED